MSNPIKPTFKTEWFSICLLLLFFLSGFFFHFNLPAHVPIHWNIYGQVDGYGSSAFSAWFLPFMALGLYCLFMFMPRFDPRQEQYADFRKTYHYFKDIMLSFIFIIFIMTNLTGLGYKIDVAFYLPLMVGVLFIVIGAFMEKIKPNWFMGVRTPWTLSSEKVWAETHKLSSKVFAVSGLLMAGTVLFPPAGKIILFVLSISIIILVLPIYSYVMFKKEKAEKIASGGK